MLSGGSYLSSNDLRLHFGLGDATAIDSVEIHWPSGNVEKIKVTSLDRIYTVEEGKGITDAMCTGGVACAENAAKPVSEKPGKTAN